MSKRVILGKLSIECTDGRAVIKSLEYRNFGGKKTMRAEGADAVKNVLIGSICYMVDLFHVGWALIKLFTVPGKKLPGTIISGDYRIYEISRPDLSVLIRSASELVPGCDNLEELEAILTHLGIKGRKGDPATISQAAREEFKRVTPFQFLDLVDAACIPMGDWEKISTAYRGGVTYNRPGEYNGNITAIDVNSLYPWAMTHFPMPVGCPSEYSDKNKAGVILVYAHSLVPKGNNIDWLPSVIKTARKKAGGYTIYTWVTDVDLKNIRADYKGIIKIIDGVYFDTVPGEDIFGPYVSKWYGVKTSEKGAARKVAKLYLNALSGSFGRKPLRDSTIIEDIPDVDGIGTKKRITSNPAFTRGYAPVIAFITAYGRDRILGDMRKIGPKNIIYSNTDSIVFSVPVPDIGISQGIGDYKIEGKYSRAKVYGHNKYYLDGPDGNKVVTPVGKIDCKYEDFIPGKKVDVERWYMIKGGKAPIKKEVNII